MGVSLTDTLMTVALIATVSAIAVPGVKNQVDSYRLGMAVRDVEREMQFARLKSVSADRPMRVRFDCPVAGKLRAVELIGTPATPDTADTAADRCDESKYPFQRRKDLGDTSRLTRPANDGAVRYLQPGVVFFQPKTLEFWPDGSVHADLNNGVTPWANIGSAGVTITLKKNLTTKKIVVNGLGKIQMDR